ncbi:MAG: class I SAM-dependent methyltransferase [Deltaproteobacteria bacterium]|nr:class I SAM-dependent methyltransferase [Deltaproteobacteria bacterium]
MDRFRRFDEAYYHRFYENPATRVVTAEEHAELARFVFSFARWNKLELKTMLDVGAGVGLWRSYVAKHEKGVKYTGTEVSAAMCKKHGFEQHDIARWRDRKKFDLIVCQGVLQYLPDPDIAPAVANLAAMSKGLVYLEITTRGDLRENVDKTRTDADIFVRNGSYYRGILQKHFLIVGAGFYWPKDVEAPFYELEVGGAK